MVEIKSIVLCATPECIESMYISVICQLANSVVNVIPLRLVDKAVSVSNNRAHLAAQVKIYCWLTVKDLFIILAGISWNV